MDSLKVFQKDPLWIKACELARLLIDVSGSARIFNKCPEQEQLKNLSKEVPIHIAKALVAMNSTAQSQYLSIALEYARNVDTVLHNVFEFVGNYKDMNGYSKTVKGVFLAFVIADQLREMIMNYKTDLECLRACP